MSDFIVKIIPSNSHFHTSAERADEVVRYLKYQLNADRIDVRFSKSPVFVDCGSNLEEILCPVCGSVIPFDYWGQVMDKANESHFENLAVPLPCCKKSSSLNELNYHFPCGFSCIEFDILNPADEPALECLQGIKKILDTDIRVIRAHV